MTHGRAGAVGHVQHRSPSQQGSEVQSLVTHGGAKAHLSWEVRSGATGHVAALEPTSVGRRGPTP
jgi:hypothetical protein